jgi:hypothetical protein
MKKISLILIFMFAAGTFLRAQDKFYTKTGTIFFRCTKSPLEKIEATNRSATCVLDTKTGSLQFAILVKGFEFERALMQEHFNENYMESGKFPRSEFKGQILNNNEINYTKDGVYNTTVKGRLKIHGETKDVETIGTLTLKDGKISASSGFSILLSDYNIHIPSIVSDKIANNVNITIDCNLELFKGQ